MQAGSGIGVDTVAAALGYQFECLFKLEAEHRLGDDGALPVVDEPIDVDMASRSGRHYYAQVGR